MQITSAICLQKIVMLWPDNIIRKHYQGLLKLIEVGSKAPRSEVRQVIRDANEKLDSRMGNV